MSLFFTAPMKAKRAKKAKPVIAGKPANPRQHAPMLNLLGCSACPLNGADVCTPKMKPTIAADTSIYFLGEAPGKEEDEQTGRPLTGPSGRLLRSCLDADTLSHSSFDYVVRDRPPDNRTPTWQEIECCRGYVTKSIEEAKPKLVVGLGAVPLSWMLGSTDLVGMRGRLFTVTVGTHKCIFLPTYHPAFILRNALDKQKPLNSKWGHCFRMDLQKALAVQSHSGVAHTSDNLRDGIQTFSGPNGFDELLSLLVDATTAKVVAIDIETYPLRPYAKDARLLTVAISYEKEVPTSKNSSVTSQSATGGSASNHNSNPSNRVLNGGGATHFAFALDHPNAGWTKEQKGMIWDYLGVLLGHKDVIKVAHNAPFEIEWFISKYGKEIARHDQWECTQMQAHFLDERLGQQYGDGDTARAVGYQGLDFLIKQHFGFSYKHLFKLDKKRMDHADLGETLVYNAVDTKLTLELYKLQKKLLKEQNLYKAYRVALPRQVTVAIMQSLGIEVDQVKVHANQEKLRAEINEINQKINNLPVIKQYCGDHGGFNPLGEDALLVFGDYLKCPEISEGGRLSLDKKVLDRIDHPLAKLILDLRNRTKLWSTYVDVLNPDHPSTVVHDDGKLHTNFNTTFTETGRTSSRYPNMQNFPSRKDNWVRGQIVAPKGHYLVAFDYGQLEACTAAMCTKDEYLVNALWNDYDVHMEFAEKFVAAGIPRPENMKAYRSLIKNKMVFPAFFGATNKSIAGYLGYEQDLVDGIMDDFYRTFKGLAKWQKEVMKTYYDTGYVFSPTGRRHGYPLSKNQVINFPIQSFACDIVCAAMDELSRKARDTRNWYLHPRLNIHDDLTFYIPEDPNILDDALVTIYRTMLSPPWKRIINVPLSVSCSIGRNWYELEEVGKFWSHKDL